MTDTREQIIDRTLRVKELIKDEFASFPHSSMASDPEIFTGTPESLIREHFTEAEGTLEGDPFNSERQRFFWTGGIVVTAPNINGKSEVFVCVGEYQMQEPLSKEALDTGLAGMGLTP